MSTRAACLIAIGFRLFAQDPQEQRAVFGITVVIPSALQGRIYYIKRNSQKLPGFKRKKPVGTIYTTTLNVPLQDFKQGFPGVSDRVEWFAIDYTGRFWAEKEGDYTFSLMSDDGSRLYIDGQLEIDNDGVHAPRERKEIVPLRHGVHDIRVSYFQGPRFLLALVLKIAPPGEQLRIFSTDELKPPPSP